MRPYISSAVFEIVDGTFAYRGWDVRYDHMYHARTPQSLIFGETGIVLSLVNREPKLDVPPGQDAELIKSDHAFKDGQRIEGEFVEVRIR